MKTIHHLLAAHTEPRVRNTGAKYATYNYVMYSIVRSTLLKQYASAP